MRINILSVHSCKHRTRTRMRKVRKPTSIVPSFFAFECNSDWPIPAIFLFCTSRCTCGFSCVFGCDTAFVVVHTHFCDSRYALFGHVPTKHFVYVLEILESLCLQRKGGHPLGPPFFFSPPSFFCFVFLVFFSLLLSFLSLFGSVWII